MTDKTILHISADFPDPLSPAKTSAVQKLVSRTKGYRHIVYSLNRVSWSWRIAALDFGPDQRALAYGAPPRGLFLETRLERVADFILDDLKRRAIEVDAIHLHKLSIEGLVGLKVAHALKRPFLVNVWGDSDLKILSVRRDLAMKWKAVLAEADRIVCCTPWTLDKIDRLYPIDRSKAVIIPYIVQNEDFVPSPVVAEPRCVSVFHLDSYRRKNFELLMKAIVNLSKSRPGIKLDVYGGGSAKALLVLDEMIRSAGAAAFVSLNGPITADALGETLRGYAAFLMPSRRETFGMVFIEALFAGLPVLHPRGWGVDGFFEPDAIGYACDPTRLEDIETGVERLLSQQEAFKGRIKTLHERGDFERFKAERIVEAYRAVLTRTLAA
jgi:glycosyltransferase involved in cell wall biosynthesis